MNSTVFWVCGLPRSILCGHFTAANPPYFVIDLLLLDMCAWFSQPRGLYLTFETTSERQLVHVAPFGPPNQFI